MYLFDNNNLFTGYIKQLLHEFNLPKARLLRRGYKVFRDTYYFDNQFLYRAVSTGVYDGSNKEALLKVVTQYVFGNKYRNITKNLELNSTIYDSYTHKYLGNYLRFQRDFCGLDVMSMYNCFSNQIGKNIAIKGSTYSFISEDDSHVIYIVPVVYGQEYTIGVDCSTEVEIMACLYDGIKICLKDDCDELYSKTYFKTAGTKFNKPFKYSKLNHLFEENNFDNEEKLYHQEPNLYLMIKLPFSSKSSVVVLEGDYVAQSQTSFSVVGTPSSTLTAESDWFIRNTESNGWIRVIDGNEAYYTVPSDTGNPVSIFTLGNTYYYLDDNNTFQSITLDPNVAYYNFLDSKTSLNYFVKNYGYEVSKYQDRSSFPEYPRKNIQNNIFVDMSTGVSYVYNTASGEYQTVGVEGEETTADTYQREYSSMMQLLFINDSVSHPFADKLIGYLLFNVIGPTDKINDNIRRVQKVFYKKNMITYPKYLGIWTQELRDKAYDYLRSIAKLTSSFDVIGFIDKDVEKQFLPGISYDETGHVISGGVR